MSFEINWDKLLEDGDQLSEAIRSFLDQRFKEMSLPSYLKSISVTSFDLGNIAPNIEIKRITDPFPEFYSDDEEDDADDEQVISGHQGEAGVGNNAHLSQLNSSSSRSVTGSTISEPPAYQTDEEQNGRTNYTAAHQGPPILSDPLLNSTFPNTTLYSPSIASSIATTNLHFPPSIQNSFISGIRSPFYPQWQNNGQIHVPSIFPVISRTNTNDSLGDQNNPQQGSGNSSGSRSSNASSTPSLGGSSVDPSANIPSARSGRENDIQFYLQISYKGDIKVGVETTLLVNYPSPNFVSLPLKLTITGLEISSIAALAYIDRKIHFSFICDLDADGNPVTISGHDRVEIIKDIKIESEIGDQEGNGPVLRNVGKIERFLLERLRHLARDELAWPGWITLEI